MTEAALQAAVIELARWAGFLHMHITDSRKSSGVGFPDLVLLHKRTGRLLFAELKSDIGKLSPEQWTWINALREGGTEAFIWRPADLTSGEIRRVLWDEQEAAA